MMTEMKAQYSMVLSELKLKFKRQKPAPFAKEIVENIIRQTHELKPFLSKIRGEKMVRYISGEGCRNCYAFGHERCSIYGCWECEDGKHPDNALYWECLNCTTYEDDEVVWTTMTYLEFIRNNSTYTSYRLGIRNYIE
jgi:hypothetical protein